MGRFGYKTLDSDMHIMEPQDLFQRYVEPRFKDQVPYGPEPFLSSPLLKYPDGRPWGMPDYMDRPRARPRDERFKWYEDQGWSPESQLVALDEFGVDVSVLFPSRGLFLLAMDPMDRELAAAVARAYNNWLYDFCQTDTTRLLGSGIISPFSMEDAQAEARRCIKELGFKTVFFRQEQYGGRNWHDPYYDPLWTTMEELDAPMSFHIGSPGALSNVGERFGSNSMLSHCFNHPMEQQLAIASFCAMGILEHHPKLRVGFLEANCSWLPHFLWRLDEHWERHHEQQSPDTKMLPSEYFRRQCYVSVDADETPVTYAIDYLGNENIVFSTDFPHGGDAKPVSEFLKLQITDEDKRKILWDNTATYYGMK